MDILWRHKEDGGQRSRIHLGDRDGEDEEPGENTGYRVDHSQDGITQKKPKISADAPLQSCKIQTNKIIKIIQVDTVKVLKLTSTFLTQWFECCLDCGSGTGIPTFTREGTRRGPVSSMRSSSLSTLLVPSGMTSHAGRLMTEHLATLAALTRQRLP